MLATMSPWGFVRAKDGSPLVSTDTRPLSLFMKVVRAVLDGLLRKRSSMEMVWVPLLQLWAIWITPAVVMALSVATTDQVEGSGVPAAHTFASMVVPWTRNLCR